MYFFFSSRRRHTRCALVTGVQTCALPIFRPADQDAPRIHLDRNDAGASFILAQRLARYERNAPVVQRTGNAGVMNDALAKRADLVRTFIDERVHPAIGGTKNRDRFASLYRQRTRAKSRQLVNRSEEHTSELQSLMRISYAVFCLK